MPRTITRWPYQYQYLHQLRHLEQQQGLAQQLMALLESLRIKRMRFDRLAFGRCLHSCNILIF